jgi:hypothetical protein
MKKRNVLFGLLAVLFIIPQQVKSQEQVVANKLFFVELGGPGVLMSANFDSRFKSGERLGLGYRIGAGFCIGSFDETVPSKYDDGYLETESRTHTYYTIPVGLNYVLGKKNSSHSFEIGAGATFLTRKVSIFNYDSDGKRRNFTGNICFMYRIAPVDGGFSFRIGFTPVIGTAGDLYPMGGLSFGYAFN